MSYILHGEVPGVGDPTSIHVTWLQNQVLVIDGVVATPRAGVVTDAARVIKDIERVQSKGKLSFNNHLPSDTSYNEQNATLRNSLLTTCVEESHRSSPSEAVTKGNSTTNNTAEVAAIFPRQLLHERHLGAFQRSFTFPGRVVESGLEATLRNGVLGLVVPKQSHGASSATKVNIEIL